MPSYDFPSSPSTGDTYFEYAFNGSSWTTNDAVFANNRFKYRSIYTRGYVSGGYKASSPWRNVNRTQHSTDTSTNLGDIMDKNSAYTMGSYSDYNQYVYQAYDGGTHTTLGNYTNSISMVTETGRTHDSAWDTPNNFGSYSDIGVVLSPGLTAAWLMGSGYDMCKHNLVTEIMSAHGVGGAYQSDFNAAWQGDTYGWFLSTYSPGSVNLRFTFATETYDSGGLTVGTNGWGKALSTKDGFAYVKNGGNVVNTVYKVDDGTGTNLNTGLTTPDGNAGEENYQTGQEHGYCLGHYNGVQNNNSYKVVHATDTFTTGGSDMQPKGHDGMSSASCASASALLIGGL